MHGYLKRWLAPFAGAALASVAACSGEAGPDSGGGKGDQAPSAEFARDLAQAEIPTFEMLKKSATRVSDDGRTYFVVEGDIPMTEAQLVSYYDLAFVKNEKKAIVRTLSAGGAGGDDVWLANEQLRLTYCVRSTGWDSTAQRDEAIAATRTAADWWERVVNVKFTYVPGQDSVCAAGNTSVFINVISWSGSGACAYWPRSGFSCAGSERAVAIDWGDFSTGTHTSVIAHELGHVLGLHHEHMRVSNSCPADTFFRDLTVYDPNSIMHYSWCGAGDTTTGGGVNITNLDGFGIRTLYGAPTTWHTSVIHPVLDL